MTSIPKELFSHIFSILCEVQSFISFILCATITLLIFLKQDQFCNARIKRGWPVPNMTNPTDISEAIINQTGTIIFLHSYGQEGCGWTTELEKIRQPYMKIICPTANVMPVRFHKNALYESWFDFPVRIWPQIDKEYHHVRGAIAYIHQFIRQEIENGISPRRIILAGSSQGGALALHSAFAYPERLGGVVVFTTWGPDPYIFEELYQPVNEDIPILQCDIFGDRYSSRDPDQLQNLLLNGKVKFNVEFLLFHGEHISWDQEFKAMKKFCNVNVPPTYGKKNEF